MVEAQKQATVFVTFITFIIIAFAFLFIFNLLKPLFILLVLLIILIIVYVQTPRFFVLLQEYERGVVFRWGKFRKIAGPGWLIMAPFIDRCKVVDLRTRIADVAPQDVVTKDDIKLKIDAIIYLKVKDPKKAVINVEDYEKAAVSYVKASLRDVVGKIKLDQAISSIEEINKVLQHGLQIVAAGWGVDVEKIEIQALELPSAVMEAMHEKRAAEERKFAQIQRAEAQKLTLDAIQAAAGKLTDPTLQYMYLQALQKMAEGKSSKIVFPMELTRLASGLASKLGATYAEAQERVVQRYQEMSKEGKKPETIVETLRKEIGLKEPKIKKVKGKRGKARFEFED